VIYFCADDYGLCDVSSMRIDNCVENGVLNKISVFPNFNTECANKAFANKGVRFSLHLNLVEGKCMTDADEIDLIADKNGNFIHTFGGLLKLNILKSKEFQLQVSKEIKAQVLFWKSLLPQGVEFCIDSHQHTHMIPGVFKALQKVLVDEQISVEYLRIPAEPVLPYIKTPSLYFTYNAVNIIKQWLLGFLYLINKQNLKKANIPTAYFMGILFSGKMDKRRVDKILPQYIKLAEKRGKDIEVLFHPGYINEDEFNFKNKNIAFEKFYLSKNRQTEFDAAIKIVNEGGVE